MPESKADLLTSVNEAAGLVQKVFFTYLLVSLYLAILIGSTTHEQLLRESGVQLPLFGVGLSMFWVYAVAPWLYLALHVNLLVQHYLLSRKLHAFNRALEMLSKEEADEWRVRLYPSMFAQMLAGAENRKFKRFVLCSIVFLTVAVAPLVLLLWMQIQFLPYHSELVTWGHRLAFFFDLALLWYYWPLMMVDKDVSWRQIVTHERPLLRSSVCALVSVGVFLISFVVAVVPGGRVAWVTPIMTDELLWEGTTCDAVQKGKAEEATWIAAVIPECLRPSRGGIRSCLQRHLDVREATLLAEEPAPEIVAALMNRNDGTRDRGAAETMRERTVGLPLEGRDLRGADFRHADLTKADLERAKLNGANLSCTKLIGANLSGAELRDADLTDATLHSAELNGAVLPGRGGLSVTKGLRTASLGKARLIGADLESMEMDGVDLLNAKLQGAQLEKAMLRGANLKRADLRGANLRGAQLQGADLSHADLRGTDLRGASIGGAQFTSAKLSYADLRGIEDKSEDIHEVIEILRVFAAHGDVLAEKAVKRLTRVSSKPIDLSGANGESVRCGQLNLGEVECLKENTVEEYRRGLVKDVLVPLFCDKKENNKETESEARALLAGLYTLASLMDEDDIPTTKASTADTGEKSASVQQLIKTVAGDDKSKVPSDVTRSVASLLAEALRNDEDYCHGRDAFADNEGFDSSLQRLDRTQPTE